ncbi:putative amidohydrolase YtcJ [Arthrobacter sp. PvP102]|uniref:amidohydrolase n=1 Tax=unclassified Arthrobacter TaxID=235627 RepID=UPI001AE91563|nr:MULTISPECIES: amidohydrolase [unclassified Arthrobacter]MBP1234532.1 putative amidohydrolase YtcJ [Arthrobacter sp. PvP103]MBP1239666.1 putative amidohydrolase YtcJ [Arthrobacter sp. PvP102]
MDNTADLLLINGVIDTLHDERPRVTSLAVKAGKVHAVGSLAEVAAGPGTEIIDLGGAYVMPGLLDVHNHHMLAGQMDLFELNEVPTKSLDDLLTAVAEYSGSLGPDEWVVGGSWGSGLLAELNSVETLARFDAATGGRPAILKDDSKHNRWVNSRGLELAGIDKHTPDPEGGQIMRDATGRATGVLIEAGGVLVEQTLARLQPRSTQDLARAAARGIDILHSYGVTGFQDAASSLQLLQALKELDDSGELAAWVVTSMQANDFIFGTTPLGEGIIAHREESRSEHHRPDFIKIFLDGVPPAGTAAFIEPYLPDAGFPECHCGGTTMPAAELERWLMGTAERGISAKIHCTGDASVRVVLDTVAKVRAAGHTTPKYHIAHGQFVQEQDIPRFAELDVTADISPSLWFPGVISEAIATVLPAERASKMQPNRSLLDAGARIAGGSDWPVSVSPNAWEGIYGLVTRQDPTGKFPGTLWPEQAISLPEAIRVYTTNSAQAMGLEDVTGSLAPGKSADFIVLSANPYEIETEQIAHIKTRQTWFAGRKVFDAGSADATATPAEGRPTQRA